MQGWIEYLEAANFSAQEKLVHALLADLSCSPWKFDLLWDVWPELGARLAAGTHESELATLSSPELAAFAAGVAGDVSAFAGLVGTDAASHLRGAYRCAWLMLRPALSRTVLSAAPTRASLATDGHDFARSGFARACASEEDVEAAGAVFEEAEARCHATGRNDLASQCRSQAHALVSLRSGALPGTAPESVTQRAFRLAFSVSDAALMRECILQWWPLFDAGFRERTLFWSGEGQEARGVSGLKNIIDSLVPAAAMLNASPGLSASAAGLLLVREASHYPPPPWIKLCPPQLRAECRQILVQLGARGEGEPRTMSAPLRQLLELSAASSA